MTKDERRFEKVMDQGAKADRELVKMAERETKRMEKAYRKSVKVCMRLACSMSYIKPVPIPVGDRESGESSIKGRAEGHQVRKGYEQGRAHTQGYCGQPRKG